MQVIFKGKVVFTSQNPQHIMEYLESSIKLLCVPDYLDHIPVTAAIRDLLSENTDYQVPYIDFFNFLEQRKALRAFLREFKLQNPGEVCTAYLDSVPIPSEYISSCLCSNKREHSLRYWELADTLWKEECAKLNRDASVPCINNS